MALDDEQLATALIDPARVFDSPDDVLADADLEDAKKIEILRRWEYDARETLVAEEEGLAPKEPSGLLDQILAALHALGTGPETDKTPPTKQGGL